MIGIGIPISQSNRPLPIEALRFSTEHQQYPREIQILNGRRLSLVPLIGFRQFEEVSFFCCCCCIAGLVSRTNYGIICRSLNSRWADSYSVRSPDCLPWSADAIGPFRRDRLWNLEHVPSQLNQGDSLRAKDERVYRH